MASSRLQLHPQHHYWLFVALLDSYYKTLSCRWCNYFKLWRCRDINWCAHYISTNIQRSFNLYSGPQCSWISKRLCISWREESDQWNCSFECHKACPFVFSIFSRTQSWSIRYYIQCHLLFSEIWGYWLSDLSSGSSFKYWVCHKNGFANRSRIGQTCKWKRRSICPCFSDRVLYPVTQFDGYLTQTTINIPAQLKAQG